jgi:aspartate racemase
MLSSAGKLARAGADFLICPDNTIHQALPLIAARSPLPWLHIVDAVGEQALARGYRRLGLLGTRWLVESEVYPARLSALGIESVRPTPEQREDINRLIMDELVCGVVNGDTVPRLQSVIQTLAADGCDAVVLGCTEIPLVINHENSRLPTLDSTRLLARAALARAIGPA